jgi:hypothetical protein
MVRAVEGLDLTLLVEGEHHGALGRVEVEAHDVAQLGHEGGIAGELEAAHAVGLEPVGVPDARNRGVMEAGGLGHQAGAPVCCHVGRRRGAQGALDDRLLVCRGDALRAAGAWAIGQQAVEPVLLVAVEPEGHGGTGDVEGRADGATRLAGRRRQDDLGALDHALRGHAGTGEVLEPGSVPAAQRHHTDGEGHDSQRTPKQPIMQDTLATRH